jgi:hypothetical protein
LAIGTFIGGRYSSTLGGGDFGLTEQGYQLVIVGHAEKIQQSDAYGDSLLDWFMRGCDVSVIADSLEYKGSMGASGPHAATWPYGTTFGAHGVIGRLASNVALSLVMSATASTPAATTPASLTAARTMLEPGFNVALLFNSRLRKVPARFACLPSDSFVHFTTT